MSFFIINKALISSNQNIRMKKLKFITCFTLFILGTQLYAQYAAVKDLATRQFPWLKNKVVLKEIPKENDEDVFVIETKKDKLYISASSTSAASRGLDWYAKHVAHQSISHMGDNKSQLAKLPQINQPKKSSPEEFKNFKLKFQNNYKVEITSY